VQHIVKNDRRVTRKNNLKNGEVSFSINIQLWAFFSRHWLVRAIKLNVQITSVIMYFNQLLR